jgi:hypothetical protein
VIISIDAEKAVDATQLQFIILKKPQKQGIKENCLNLEKGIFFLAESTEIQEKFNLNLLKYLSCLLVELVYSSSVSRFLRIFWICYYIICKKKNVYFFPVWKTCISFSYIIALAETASTVLNRRVCP